MFFYSFVGEGFVVRWEYAIVTTRVLKMLNDINEAKNSGRHKCAYFFWLGNDCPITEKGATAVMTVELDKERGPQVIVLKFEFQKFHLKAAGYCKNETNFRTSV